MNYKISNLPNILCIAPNFHSVSLGSYSTVIYSKKGVVGNTEWKSSFLHIYGRNLKISKLPTLRHML